MILKKIMEKRYKLLLIAAGSITAVIIIIFLLTNNQLPDSAGIIDKKYRITQQHYWSSLTTGYRFDNRAVETYFKNDIANNHTLDFFSYCQSRFKDMEYSEHMQAVRKYLHDTIQPPEKAEQIYELYGKYNEYQKELYLDQKRWAGSGTPEEMLENLRKIQDFRRQHFGENTADSIFGVEVKSNEYALRKQIIIGDTGMTGREKEERLASLRCNMWGDQAETVDDRQALLDRYNEKLKIHEADLAGMSKEDRERKISEFRRRIFTPEEAERMDNADRQLKYIRERDIEYSRLSRAILDNNDLSEQEKNRKIMELHNKLYGGSGKTP